MHRVALSYSRILAVHNGRVMFQWKDYRSKHRQTSRIMTVDAGEFIRHFMIHTFRPGFQRIRHFGFLANRFRQEKLALCRKLLSHPTLSPVQDGRDDPSRNRGCLPLARPPTGHVMMPQLRIGCSAYACAEQTGGMPVRRRTASSASSAEQTAPLCSLSAECRPACSTHRILKTAALQETTSPPRDSNPIYKRFPAV